MRFVVSSTDLLQGLLSVQRVIGSKSSLPILESFLFVLEGNTLTVTASDSETTLKTVLTIDSVEQGGEIAVPAKLLTDSLKELPTQPIEVSTEDDRNLVNIIWANGSAQIPYSSVEEYPELPTLNNPTTLTISAETLADGINSTVYATADEELRPVMNGIFFDIAQDSTTLVASNAHKLVYYKRTDINGSCQSSFILPKKPANILKNNLAKVTQKDVEISFDNKNAYFKCDNFLIVCRLVEGTYPAYKSVIPKNNTNVITVSRTELLNATKRVAVCSNQATSSMKFSLSFNNLTISAQDIGFAISAHETIACQYDGSPMDIGFKAPYLIEILSNLPYEEICFELADHARAALIVPATETDSKENIRSLLMPIRITN